jgi:rhamnopyranosyl-N-acetylglucosaminyl-diphospho-decaprenol beta-1,3/1,4-galactofuranosyltransferase
MIRPLTVRAVVVTYRRPDIVDNTVGRLLDQTYPIHQVVLVDNDPDGSGRPIADRFGLEYLLAGSNVGPAGGIALGMSAALEAASDDDLVLLVDDDDPLPHDDTLERLVATYEAASSESRCACVGLTGARYRRSTGRFARVPDAELNGLVPVDYVGGGHCPLYSTAALREVGVFRDDYFFGFEEAEFGLRLRRAGWQLLVPGGYWMEQRQVAGRTGLGASVMSIDPPMPWRQYYSSRNALRLAREYGTSTAVVVTAIRGLLLTPLRRIAVQHSLAAGRASVSGTLDGLLGRSGLRPTWQP